MAIAAVLWDMDGVLAEVSQSYRRAIIDTGAHYGVEITPAEIEAAKAAGHSNCDWDLTYHAIETKLKLAADPKSIPTLEQVTEVFEGIYQGTDDHPGLYQLETLLVPKGVIAEVHRRVQGKMAVVTGRPRKDCAKFLTMHGLQDLFPVCICMEDGPPKPSPEPVLLALRQLGVDAEHAAMMGDTVDDITAAREAGVTAWGVLTTQVYATAIVNHTPFSSQALLEATGATAIMTPGLPQLLDLVPALSVASLGAAVSGKENKQRQATVSRVTKETSIHVTLNLDGTGTSTIHSGLGFLDHMLTALAKHSRCDLTLECKGDTWIDDHHSVEDCALTLGEALDKALGDRAGIARFGSAFAPLDESLARAVIDISSRAHSEINLELVRPTVGDVSCEMLTHFFESFASTARITLHVDVLRGRNDHHRAEAAFKALAMALRAAVQRDASAGVPSTKGVLA